MPLTTVGRDFIATAIINNATPSFYDFGDATIGAKIGVGDSTTVFSAAHTNLQAATNKLRIGMDGSFPSIATNVLTFQSTFGTGDANYSWDEWAIFNHITDGSGEMLSRKVEPLGVKTNAQTWQITVTLDVLIG